MSSRSIVLTVKTCATCGSPFVGREAKHCSQRCRYASRRNTEADFWACVDKSGECWLWTGSVAADGYGQFVLAGVHWRAPRLAWFLAIGPIADNLCVLHNCPGGDNPLCCNPDHLFLGTRPENQADMAKKRRSTFGEKSVTAKLTEGDVLAMRQERLALGTSYAKLGAKYGVSDGTAKDAVRRRTWKHLP